ncbi:hypothetical protein Droror1_Dr00003689 [Drosera rotundifolia]
MMFIIPNFECSVPSTPNFQIRSLFRHRVSSSPAAVLSPTTTAVSLTGSSLTDRHRARVAPPSSFHLPKLPLVELPLLTKRKRNDRAVVVRRAWEGVELLTAPSIRCSFDAELQPASSSSWAKNAKGPSFHGLKMSRPKLLL